MKMSEYLQKWYGEEIAAAEKILADEMSALGWEKTGETEIFPRSRNTPQLDIFMKFRTPEGSEATREKTISSSKNNSSLKVSRESVRSAMDRMKAEQVDDFFSADNAEKIEKILDAAKNGIWIRDEKGHFSRLEV